MPGSLILVGVVHRDPEGYDRLLRLIESLEPDALCVELSPLGLTWRERHCARLKDRLERILDHLPREARRHHQVLLIQAALAMPFEYAASSFYASSHRVPLHLVDLNRVSRAQLPLYESEILAEENIGALVGLEDHPLEGVIRRAYGRAMQCLCDPLDPTAGDGGMLDLRRERFMACRVERIAQRHGRVVCVVGWEHLRAAGRGHGLAALLGHLRPLRILLRGGGLPPLQ